ncbi:MAG: hypothetical protein WAZ98_12095 [Cyclobacteriaceae bacterium]
MKIAGSLGLFFLLFSCEQETRRPHAYYPVDSLIHAQVKLLQKSGAVLTKKAEIDGVEDETSFTPKDSTAWANELDIFFELSLINNPIHAGKYVVENGLNDQNSNLSIRSYTGKNVLPVVYLKLFYLDKPSNIRRMEALYREENALLKGSRLLILEFQEIRDQTVLTSYSIEGSQKMFLGNLVQFSIKGTITLL